VHSGTSVQPVVCTFKSNAHSHSATLRLVHNVGTTKRHGAKSRNFNRDRRMRTKSFGIREFQEESAGSDWDTSLGSILDCTVLWHQGERKVESYRRVLVENKKKGLRRTTELMSPNVFDRVRKLQNRPLYASVRTFPRLIITQLWRYNNIRI
jgi:hypothetical protein